MAEKHYYGIRLSVNPFDYLMHKGVKGMKWYQHIYGDDRNSHSNHYRLVQNKLDNIIAQRNSSSHNVASAIHAKNATRDISSKKNPARFSGTGDISHLKNPSRGNSYQKVIRGANGEAYWQGAGTQPVGYGRAGTLYQRKMMNMTPHYSDDEEDEEDENGRRRKRMKNAKDMANKMVNKHR